MFPEISLATAMIEIPGGSFMAGSSQLAEKNNPAVAVESFFIDEFETTNVEFATVFPDHHHLESVTRRSSFEARGRQE